MSEGPGLQNNKWLRHIFSLCITLENEALYVYIPLSSDDTILESSVFLRPDAKSITKMVYQWSRLTILFKTKFRP